MIKFSVALCDLSREWTCSGSRWSSGDSWIEPYRHPALETRTTTDGMSWALTVRERSSQAPSGSAVISTSDLSGTLAEWRRWPLGSVVLHVERDRITLTGTGGVAPVHLTSSGNRVECSWDLTDLRPHLSSDRLVGREVARILAGHARYGHESLFADVHLLTVGAEACFTPGGLALRYPKPVGRDQPRELMPGVDPVKPFEALLEWVLAQRPVRADRTAIQLSGGQDSATVGLSLGELHPGSITPCAMTLPGPAGTQQRTRRNELINSFRLGTDDVTVAALDHLPLHPAGVRRTGLCSAYDEPYAELLEALSVAMDSRGVDTVFTGFGGDELMSVPTQAKRPTRGREWLGPRARDDAERDAGIAPPTAIPETALLALRTVSTPLLRAGLWPVAPLTDPHLVRFARWLPEEWRANKRLFRERLVCRGVPHHVVRPALRENFTQVMGTGLHRYAPAILREIASESPLVEAGFLDRRALMVVADDCGRSVERAIAHSSVYAAIALHLALRPLS